MKPLRRSGGLIAFTVAEQHWEVRADEVAGQRFRSIDTAASEEVSVGWCRPDDPSGGNTTPEELSSGTVWLRFRVDVKRLPAVRKQLELDAIQVAAGRRLSARERRDALAEIESRLLPTTPPRTQFVDVLVSRDRAVLLSASKAAAEHFAKLWRATFGSEPVRQDVVGLVGDVGELRPTRFCGTRQEVLPADGAFLGPEFLTWLLWRQADRAEGDVEIVVVGTPLALLINDRLSFRGDNSAAAVRGALAAISSEASAALADGHLLVKARMELAAGARSGWVCTVDGDTLALSGARLPDDPDECESAEDRTASRAADWLDLHTYVRGLFERFVALRRSAGWSEIADRMRAWMESA